MFDLPDLFTLFLLVLAVASALALALSLLTLALRGRRRRDEPPRDAAGPRHWSGDEYAERLRRVYFQKERRARAIRERDRQAREAHAHARQAAEEPVGGGDGEVSATPEGPAEGRYRAVLGLEGEVTPERLRLAYRRMIAAYHPDKVAGLGVKLQRLAEEETKAINEAYAFFRKRYEP